MASRVGADKDVVETVHGKHAIYEIVKSSNLLSPPTYHVYKNGKHHRGSFSSIASAVEAAKEEG